MGIGQNLYSGSAALGKIKAFITMVCCMCLACVFSAAAIATFFYKPRKGESRARLGGVILSVVASCLVMAGVCCFILAQQSKPVAALSGAGMVFGF